MVIDMEKDEYGVRLTITSDSLNLEELTKLFDVNADTELVKGEPVTVGGKPLADKVIDQDTWVLDSRLHVSKYNPLEEHVEFIAGILAHLPETAANVFKPGDIEVALSCFEHSTNPGAHLESKFIKLLSKFKADVDIDFFAVGP
jgi:hypothetical protein